MPPWRARMYITQNAGRLVPFKMMDVDLITAAYLSLSPEDQHRYAALNLTAPISVARKILISKLINTFSITVILLSIILLCVETDPVLKPYDVMIIFWLEFFCMTVFLTEIVLQRICIRMSLFQCMRSQFPKFNHRMSKLFQLLYTYRVDKAPQFFAFHPSSKEAESPCPSSMGQQTKNHCFRQIQFQYLDTDYVKWNWLLIDLIAVVPFAVQVIVYGIQSTVTGEGFTEFRARMYSWEGNPDILRLLRLFRILRLFKVGQKSDRIRMIWKAVANSTDGIFLLFMIVPLFVVFFSFVLFYAEMNSGYLAKGVWYYSDGRLSKFQSIADCMWCLMQTLTTVETPQGKIVMGIVMLLSLFIIAFPLCMITMQYTHHARMYSEQTKAHTEAAHRLRERMAVVDESAAFIPTSPTPSPPPNAETKRPHRRSIDFSGSVETLLSSFKPSDKKGLDRIETVTSTKSSSSSILKQIPHHLQPSSTFSEGSSNTPFRYSPFRVPLRGSPTDEATTPHPPTHLQSIYLTWAPPHPIHASHNHHTHTHGITGIREVERNAEGLLVDTHPAVVVLKVQDWKVEYKPDKREDVLTVRVRCKDEEGYRRLMKVLAEFD
ncbi:voltage-gated potassium channel [Rhizoclosmatium globosum]|uniref:Voltage-gated potassium channel n=1 Tax=Rhizoclosmatium globosum TaxID=329046 RepID=A0A1Y2CR78_9FUNG|nr:voltage-gated potassium channel [Rhizoclosmatium globosum]|eukprot:ORY49473.1 voltage-gated potassium channel [Rhizoclosmatium globosum]